MRLIFSLIVVLCACVVMAHAADLTGVFIGQVATGDQPLGKGEKTLGLISVIGLVVAIVYYIFFKKDDKK